MIFRILLGFCGIMIMSYVIARLVTDKDGRGIIFHFLEKAFAPAAVLVAILVLIDIASHFTRGM
jgi:hypothetical protein